MDTPSLNLRRSGRRGERAIEAVLAGCVLLTALITLGIILALLTETVNFFRQVSLGEFLLPGAWEGLHCDTPEADCGYSIWPLLNGTLLVTAVALLLAFPTGLLAAVYLSEYASRRLRGWLKPILEVLAGIPTVVYGYFALTFVTPSIIKPLLPDTDTFNALAAGIVVGVLILPLVASISQDALTAVPMSLRAGGQALGARKARVTVKIVLPAALSGIVASIILAGSRAIGETMAVVLAAGNTPRLTLDATDSIQTMTAYIVQVSLGDTPQTDYRFTTLFAVGMTLFVITFALNLLAAGLVRRFRQEY